MPGTARAFFAKIVGCQVLLFTPFIDSDSHGMVEGSSPSSFGGVRASSVGGILGLFCPVTDSRASVVAALIVIACSKATLVNRILPFVFNQTGFVLNGSVVYILA